MSRAQKVFNRNRPSQKAPGKNRDGYPAWQRPLSEQYLQTLLTNTLGNTFYVSQKDLVAESAEIHGKMLTEDSDFAAKALAYARNRGFMRTQPTYGLARLAGVNRQAFREVFDSVIRTPNDLRDFATIVGSLRQGEGGSTIKKVAGKWLVKNLTSQRGQYWAIKYGSQGRDGYSMADLIKVYHANFGGQKNPLVSWLFGKEADLASLPQVQAFEALKRADSDEDKIRLITEGRLPVEVASSFAGKSKAVWAAIAPQMPIFALTRHLATLERHGVLDAVRDVVIAKLTTEDAVRKSKMFPHRFLEASKHVHDARVADALRDAVDLSFANVPDIEGRTAIFLDISGSMGNFIQQAALFGVAAMKKANGDGRFLAYDTRVDEIRVSMRDSVLTQAQKIRARGGTNTALPMQKLLQDRDKVDNIVLITDEQQNAGCPFVDVFTSYLAKVNRDVKLFVMDVSPYRNALTPDMPGVWYIYGWSDTALQFVAMNSRGWGSQVEEIKSGSATESAA
jgi:60 kDa SS-A/Ro ribonucleoprotein